MNSKAAAKISNLLQIAVVKICQEVIDFADELIVQGVISVEADGQDICTVSFKETADKLGLSGPMSEPPGNTIEKKQDESHGQGQQCNKKQENTTNNNSSANKEDISKNIPMASGSLLDAEVTRVKEEENSVVKCNHDGDSKTVQRKDSGGGSTCREEMFKGKNVGAGQDESVAEPTPNAENVLVNSLVAQALKLWYNEDTNSASEDSGEKGDSQPGPHSSVHQKEKASFNGTKVSNETLGRSGYDSLKTVVTSLSSCHLGVPKSSEPLLVDGKDTEQISNKKLNEDSLKIQRQSPLQRQQAEPPGAGPIPQSIYSQQASGSSSLPSLSPQLLISSVPESAKHSSATILPHHSIIPSALASQSCQINGYFDSIPAVAKTPPLSRSSSAVSLPPTDSNNRPSSSQTTPQKMHRCNICLKDFTFSTNRTRHQRNIHGRPYCRKGKESDIEEKPNLSSSLYFKPNNSFSDSESTRGALNTELPEVFSGTTPNYPNKDEVSRHLNLGIYSPLQGPIKHSLVPKYEKDGLFYGHETAKSSVIKHTLSFQEAGMPMAPLHLQKRSLSLPTTRPEEFLPRSSYLPKSLGDWHSKDILSGPNQKFLKCHFCNLSFPDFQRLMVHMNAVHQGDAESMPLFLHGMAGYASQFNKASNCDDGPIDMRTTPPVVKQGGDTLDPMNTKGHENVKPRKMSSVGQWDIQGLNQSSVPEDLRVQDSNIDREQDGNSRLTEGGSPRGRYPCGSCGHIFTLPSNLRRHVRNMHSSDSASSQAAHICDLCGAAYPISSELHNHLRLVHQVLRDVGREDRTNHANSNHGNSAIPENLTVKTDKLMVPTQTDKTSLHLRSEAESTIYPGSLDHRSQDGHNKPSGTGTADIRESSGPHHLQGHNLDKRGKNGKETGSQSSEESGETLDDDIQRNDASSRDPPEYGSTPDLTWGSHVKNEYRDVFVYGKSHGGPVREMETNDVHSKLDQDFFLTRRSSDEENIPQGDFCRGGKYLAGGKIKVHDGKGFIENVPGYIANGVVDKPYDPNLSIKTSASGVDLHKVIENVVHRSLLDVKCEIPFGTGTDMNDNSSLTYLLEKGPLSQNCDSGNLLDFSQDPHDKTAIQARYPHLKELIISRGKPSSRPNSPSRSPSPLNLMTKPKYKGKFKKYFAMEEKKKNSSQNLPLNSAKENGLPQEPYIGEDLNLKISVQNEEMEGKHSIKVGKPRVPTAAEKKLFCSSWDGKSNNQVLSESFPAISDGKRFVCGLCGNSFTFQTNLTRHQRRTHGKPYVRKPAIDRKLVPGHNIGIGLKSEVGIKQELGLKHEHTCMIEQPGDL